MMPNAHSWRAGAAHSLCTAVLFFFVSPAVACGGTSFPRQIFFIVIDTLGADHLGSYGYGVPTSPTLDRLAKEGVVFEHAFATASQTSESVPSFFTSTTAITDRFRGGRHPAGT